MTNDSPTLILAIPGTQDTQELLRETVIEGIRNGEIGQDRWVWSPADNDWKQVAEIPELQIPLSVHEPVEAAPALSDTQQLARTVYSQPMEIKHEFPIFKVLFTLSFLIVAALVGVNYLKVEQPFANSLAATSFASVPTYAHLAAFMQPSALVIHVRPSEDLNADNFADFLVALAQSTPPQPFSATPFKAIGLTAAWQSQYVFNGEAWQKLAQMQNLSPVARKRYVLEHFEQMDGTPLLTDRRGEDSATTATRTTKAWQEFVSNFVSQP